MRIFLSGQRTFGNRGCEAIVRSTISAIRNVYPGSEFLVPSDDIVRDSLQWPESSHSGVEFVNAYLPLHLRYWVHTQRLPIPVLKRAGWPFPFPRWLKEQISSVDAVLSVGGDNYSLDYRLPSLLMGLDKFAGDLRKSVSLWGASVGPFEREPYFMPAMEGHLARMNRIFVRESFSYGYLTKTLGLKNVMLMADPAFTLKRQKVECSAFWPSDKGRGVIGLNVSPLIERYKKQGQDFIAGVTGFVRSSVFEFGYGVLLIPHVIPLDGSPKNNDEHYMRQILSACSDMGSSVTMMPACFNASQIKYVISCVRFFIGARTHATIAALSSGVPTVSIAYSVKARGINRDLFGTEDVVLPTSLVSKQTLLSSLTYLERHESELRRTLEHMIPQYVEKVNQAVFSLNLKND